MARPISTYTDEERAGIIEHVLAELSGGRAVSRTLREDEGMCPKSTFWNWCFNDEVLMGKVARAREHGVESIMDETLEIADYKKRDTIKDGEGNERPDTEWISRSKLRVDTRHKYAQMIAPRKYGPKLDLTSDGKSLEMDDIARVTRLAAIFSEIDKAGHAPD